MCGRYNSSTEESEKIREIIRQAGDRLYGKELTISEIRPTDLAPVLIMENGQITPVPMTWGFPRYGVGGVVINARSETVLEKRMFRDSVLKRRCLVPSTGFYEWRRQSPDKDKLLFRRPGDTTLYMAGVYDSFREADGSMQKRFVILTTAANDSLIDHEAPLSLFAETAKIHDRMPVVILEWEKERWLTDDAAFQDLFHREDIGLDYTLC